MQRAVGAVLVAVLVVLAGCSGVFFGGGEEPTETLTPAAVPTDEPTPTPIPRLAPGLTEQGIESSLALADAHGSFLRNTSFTTTSNTTTVATNGTVLIQRTSTLRAGPNGTGFYLVFERNGSYYPESEVPLRTESWSDGEEVFVKQTYANGTATYERLEINAALFRYQIAQGNPELFLGPFDSNTTTVTERFSRNGSTLYRVRGNRTEAGQGNVTLRLLVDERGVIHSYRTALEMSFDENISRSVTETRFLEIGTADAPERPSWVGEAINQTAETSQTETTREQ